MGDGNFLTPLHRICTPWPISKKTVASDYVGDPYGCAKFGANPSTGGFWANGWNITKILFIYLYLFFMNSPTDQTRRRIFTLDGSGSNDADSRNDVPFGVSLTLLPILGVKSPENPNFWGVNRRFRAKRTKINNVLCYRNYCINFNQILHNDRDCQVVVIGGPNRCSTNPRWWTAAILKDHKNRDISTTV